MPRYPEACCTVPVLSNPRPIFALGQSNRIGQGQTPPAGTPILTAGMMLRDIDRYETRDDVLEQMGLSQGFHGSELQMALDLIGLGHHPYFCRVGRNATAVNPYFITGVGAQKFQEVAPMFMRKLGLPLGSPYACQFGNGEQESSGAGDPNFDNALAALQAMVEAVLGTNGFFYWTSVNTNLTGLPGRAVVNTAGDAWVAAQPSKRRKVSSDFISGATNINADNVHYLSPGYNLLGSAEALFIDADL